MNKNYPLIIITGFGIIASLVLVYLYVYQRAINSVRSAALIEKAYPVVKPEEYINQLRIDAKKNNLRIVEITKTEKTFIIQIVNQKLLEKLININPGASVLTIVNLSIYDLGDGTAVVGNNPYLWDIMMPSNYIDDIAEGFSKDLSDILDNIYWEIKKKKEAL
jgi:hypothetical protein